MPAVASIRSRRASASSRRSGIRQYRELAESIDSFAGSVARRLPIDGRGHDPLVHPLQAPPIARQFDGQQIQKLGNIGPAAENAEIAGCVDERTTEVVFPDSIHQDPADQRMPSIGQVASPSQAAAGCGQHRIVWGNDIADPDGAAMVRSAGAISSRGCLTSPR